MGPGETREGTLNASAAEHLARAFSPDESGGIAQAPTNRRIRAGRERD